jgi:hypothetical protein
VDLWAVVIAVRITVAYIAVPVVLAVPTCAWPGRRGQMESESSVAYPGGTSNMGGTIWVVWRSGLPRARS